MASVTDLIHFIAMLSENANQVNTLRNMSPRGVCTMNEVAHFGQVVTDPDVPIPLPKGSVKKKKSSIILKKVVRNNKTSKLPKDSRIKQKRLKRNMIMVNKKLSKVPTKMHKTKCGATEEEIDETQRIFFRYKCLFWRANCRIKNLSMILNNSALSAARMGHEDCLEFFLVKQKELKVKYALSPRKLLQLVSDAIDSGSVPCVQVIAENLKKELQQIQFKVAALMIRHLEKHHDMMSIYSELPNLELFKPLMEIFTEERSLAWICLEAFVKKKVLLLLWALRQSGGMFFDNHQPYFDDDIRFYVHGYKGQLIGKRIQMIELMHKFQIRGIYDKAFNPDQFWKDHYQPCPVQLDPNDTDPVKRHFLNMYSKPMSLQVLARLAVVRKIGVGYEYKLKKLPVPTSIHDFLLFRDIVPEDV